MEKIVVIKNNIKNFYHKIYFLRVVSAFHINVSVVYNNKKYHGLDNKHPKEIDEILKIIDILNTHKRKEKYNLIYNYACEYLDNEFINNNWCDFKKNMCISNRNKSKEYQVGSCCTHNTHNKETCPYFDNNIKRCSIRCLSCKLFVCPYLSRKGVKYRINEVPYLKYFLSFRQKIIAKISFFKPQEVIVYKWLRFYHLV